MEDWLDILIWSIGIFGFGFGLPYVLGFGWMKWIENSTNKFRFFQYYLIINQVVLSILFLFEMGSYFPPQASLWHIVKRSPTRYWYYFFYMITSLSLILLYATSYGRTKTGARIATALSVLNIPVSWLGVSGIIPRTYIWYFPDILSASIFAFKFMMSLCILVPQWGWSVVFGALPTTLYLTGKKVQIYIYREETFVKQLRKWITDNLKEIEGKL
jgi:hypothetical protein